MSVDSIKGIAQSLNRATLTLAAFGAALDDRINGVSASRPVAEAVHQILSRLDLAGPIAAAPPAQLAPLLAEIRLTLLQAVDLVGRPARVPGWTHTDAATLDAAGAVSTAFPRLVQQIAPSLDGLAARLSAPGAAFLDVGAGVAALSVAMARLWPNLRIVGLDPWPPSIELARRHVAATGLGDRIELRMQKAQDLRESQAFDLCWIPTAFIAGDDLPRVLCRAIEAIRPGGWLLAGMVNPGDDDQAMEIARLRTAMFGGTWTIPDVLQSTLQAAGLTAVCLLPVPPSSPTLIAAGQRP